MTLRFTHARETLFPAGCKTEGAAAEEVLLLGEYHVVFTSFSPLTVGLLITFPETSMKCASTYIAKGPVLLGMKITLLELITGFSIKAKCAGAGLQELTSYFNEEKTLVEKQLMSWLRSEIALENTCLATASETAVSSTKKFLVLA